MSRGEPMLAPQKVMTWHGPNADELRALFHRLNNQLGIVLANAELLQSRVADEVSRSRVEQVIDGALQAMATVRELRGRIERESAGDEPAL
jgi:hypothetical protein